MRLKDFLARIGLRPKSDSPEHQDDGIRAVAVLIGVMALIWLGHTLVSGGSKSAAQPMPGPTPADERFERFKGECRTYGIAYENPGKDAEDRIKVFGTANDQSKLETVFFFNQEVIVQEKVAPCLEAVEHDLEDQGTTYKVNQIGAYREERADRPYWFHQYGGGVDINPKQNPQCLGDLEEGREGAGNTDRCALERPYDLPQEWIDTFARYGFYWGGNFSEGKDYMHFEWHGEKP